MKCPYCYFNETFVISTKHRVKFVWRRRKCPKCGRRFTTREYWNGEDK